MCGIVGYTGSNPELTALDVVLGGLRRLEYRGYDSAGVALKLRTQAIVVERAVGRVATNRSGCSAKARAALRCAHRPVRHAR
jgi:glucosamine--fructose-6-phosphate aminotransferase (isomerizing)